MRKKKQVSIHEARTHLSKLMNEALAGVEIIFANGGTQLVKIVLIEKHDQDPATKVLGKYDNLIKSPEDFDAPLSDWEE